MTAFAFLGTLLGWSLAFVVLRFILLWWLDYVTWPQLHWTGAFRSPVWRWLGACIEWRSFDGADFTVTGSVVVHRGHRDNVLGLYLLSWRWQWPADDGYVYGWAFGPVAYSYTTF